MNTTEQNQMIQYKDFPKFDSRRLLVILFAIERLGEKATLHYIAQDVGCTRADAQRAVDMIQRTFLVDIEKTGPVFAIKTWGILNADVARQQIFH